MHRVGVLFVHGIGTQPRGGTLADWGGALIAWINRWIIPPGSHQAPAIAVQDAVLTADSPSEPSYAVVTFAGQTGAATAGPILLAESWWAETILPPTYRDLLHWSLVIVPWTVGSHFLTRMRRTPRDRVLRMSWHLLTLLAAMLLMPLLLGVLALVLLLGLIPWAPARGAAGAVQRTLASTIGDSFVLLHNDIQRAAIVARVARDLRWLAGRCERTVIVAHSQGAAVAHMVLKGVAPAEQEQTGLRDLTLVTFGPGIAKLAETDRLMRGDLQGLAGPWLLSFGGALLAVMLWLGLPSLWQLRDQVLVAGGLYLAAVLLLSLAAAWLPKWVLLVASLLIAVPISFVLWQWLDRGPAALLLLAGVSAITVAFSWMKSEPFFNEPSAAAIWRDLYGSRDPVSNGPLFQATTPADGQALPRTSDEVWIRRSLVADHTGYWMSTDDFVARVACLIAGKAGVRLDDCRPGDGPRLSLARQRRRWRTAWRSAASSGALLSFFLILAARGVPTVAEPAGAGSSRPLQQLQHSSTVLAGELIGFVVPELVKKQFADPPSSFPAAPSVVAASSVLLLLMLIGSASLVVSWRWQAWDRAEIGRLFQRQNVAVLEPQFVAFLLCTIAIAELVVFTALGWTAGLRGSSAATLKAIGGYTLACAGVAAGPWIIRLAYFWVGQIDVARTIRRAAAAATIAALAVLPMLVWSALYGDQKRPIPDRVGFLVLAVIPLIWLVSVSGVWRRFVERLVAPRVFAGEP